MRPTTSPGVIPSLRRRLARSVEPVSRLHAPPPGPFAGSHPLLPGGLDVGDTNRASVARHKEPVVIGGEDFTRIVRRTTRSNTRTKQLHFHAVHYAPCSRLGIVSANVA